uniref:Uncharacterized protein n=1 Tax=Plectus sambesii TaxID=2011161 RepID=A0A914WW13_9BILA
MRAGEFANISLVGLNCRPDFDESPTDGALNDFTCMRRGVFLLSLRANKSHVEGAFFKFRRRGVDSGAVGRCPKSVQKASATSRKFALQIPPQFRSLKIV